MPVHLLMWFCRVVIRFLRLLVWGTCDTIPAGLDREATMLMEELNAKLWPDGKPPKSYEE